ncbi:YlbL family protein [Kocuria atrinae]|uniref:YlbL family protein n=1 Tax=Kocuria atrinae TaxID=592377 RepID=UPI0031CF57BA
MSGSSGSSRWTRWRKKQSLESVGLMGTAALLIAGVVLPAPFVVESSGPTFNTVGEYEDHQLVSIEGAQTYPSDGKLDLTTVYVKGGPAGRVNAVNVLMAWFDPTDTVLPEDAVYDPTLTGQEVDESNAAAMQTSQEDSVAAALDYLDKPYKTTLQVHASIPDTPADGVLEPGDTLLALNSEPITELDQLRDGLDEAGEKGVDLTVKRGEETVTHHVDLSRSEDTGRWQLGVYLTPEYDFPFTVDFELEQVGGPSAGMMFALGVIEELTPGSMVGTEHVAGTGTITPQSEVGPIGGIRQKLEGSAEAGARYFLAPSGNCNEVRGYVPEGMDVIEVETLGEAVNAVEQAAAGNVSSLPSCGTR